MAMRIPSKRNPPNIKRLAFLFFFIVLILYWDLFLGIPRGLLLVVRPPAGETSIAAEILRLWGSFALFALLFFFTFSLFLFLIAHFILPNLSLEQHLELWKRLWRYLIGRHGAAIFLRNGKVVGEFGEKSRKGVGLLLIDRQSAAVIEEFSRKKTTQVKVFAPGIVFLNQRQKIRGGVDLQPQRRSIAELHAYTKDGIEIITNLSTTFTLGQPPEILLVTYQPLEPHHPDANCLRVIQFSQPPLSYKITNSFKRTVSSLSNELDPVDREEIHRFVQNFHLEQPERTNIEESSPSQYFVDSQRIMAAFYAIPSSSPLQTALDWTELPLQIAIDLFREFIAAIPYESIYAPHRPIAQTLVELKSQFSKRLRNQGVLAFQFVQRKDNLPIRVGDEWDVSKLIFFPPQKLSSPKFLRSKGIKILNATFGELQPADEMIERRLFEQWLLGYQQGTAQPLNNQGATSPMTVSFISQIREEMANKLTVETAPSRSETQLALFFERLENEIADPSTRKWLPEETIHRLRQLRRRFMGSEPPSASLT